MAFNTSTKKIMTKRLIKTIESKVNGKFTLNGEKTMERILDGYGLVSVTEEVVSGEFIQFKGNVNFTTVFTLGDKTIDSEQVVLEFQEKSQIESVDSIVIVPEITNFILNKESDNMGNITVFVKFKLYAEASEEYSLITGEEENYYTQKEVIKTSSVVASTKSNFTISEEVKINGNVDRVVLTTLKATLNGVTSYDNYTSIDGTIYATILYYDGENIRTFQKGVDFTQEVSVLNLSKDMKLDVDLWESGALLSNNGEDSGSFILDASLGCSVWGYKEEEIEITKDVFSSENNLVVTTTSFNGKVVSEKLIESDRQTITIDMTNKKRMDEIIFLTDPKVVIEQASSLMGQGTITGFIEQKVIFKNYDNDEISSMTISSPIELKVNGINLNGNEDVYYEPTVVAKVNSFKNKAGKDISETIDFDIFYIISYDEMNAYVSKIEEKNKLPEKNYSIKICRPQKTASVYEIAKELEVSPEILLAQNPGLEDGNILDKVIVYLKAK